MATPTSELVPDVPGVYLLYVGSECIYIGSSLQMQTRVRTHEHGAEVTQVRFLQCAPVELAATEQALIEAHRPRLNKVLRIVRGSSSQGAILRRQETRRLKQISASPLTNARQSKGLTTQQVANRLGVNQGFLSRVERGKLGASVETCKTIAAMLGMSVDELFEPTIMRARQNRPVALVSRSA